MLDASCSRELLILLEAAEPVEVELYVSYVVSKAKWSPKYDIRVFSADNSMKVRHLAMRVVKFRNGRGFGWGTNFGGQTHVLCVLVDPVLRHGSAGHGRRLDGHEALSLHHHAERRRHRARPRHSKTQLQTQIVSLMR